MPRVRPRSLALSPCSFPSLEGVYRSSFLLSLFSNRVMNHSREEYDEYVADLGLSPDQAEPFTVLARSGGRRSTDKLEVFAPPTVTSRGVELPRFGGQI
jgi:hypothetical protein